MKAVQAFMIQDFFLFPTFLDMQHSADKMKLHWKANS